MLSVLAPLECDPLNPQGIQLHLVAGGSSCGKHLNSEGKEGPGLVCLWRKMVSFTPEQEQVSITLFL